MLPNRTGIDDSEFVVKPRVDTNGNTALVGHHRNKLDLIRDSLRPFEQPTQEKLLLNSTINNQMMVENSHAACPVNEDSRIIMINALMQVGYDKESAYYALKLVNFKSVTDAVKVLSSLKTYNTSEPTHLKYALGAQATSAFQPSSQMHPLQYAQAGTSNQLNYIDSEYDDQLNRHPLDNYTYFESPNYLSGQTTSRMPVKQSNSFNPTIYEQKTKVIKSSSVIDTPVRSTLYQPNTKISLATKDSNNVPVIRSKLDRTFAPARPIKNIIIDPDINSITPRLTMSNNRNETKSEGINEISRKTANLQIQTSNLTPNSDSTYSSKSETSTSKRCISPISDSIARRVKSKEYESSIKSCKPAMYRFFMEQHTEKIIQQYAERNQRATQLNNEMEAADLPEKMKEAMFKYLCQKESRYIRLKRQKMNKSMFEMIRHIGVGAFGKVSLVRKKDTREVYAMKTLSKEDIIQKQQLAHARAERDILAEANSEWIVKLYYSFQDAHNLYFIMDYIPGGDLMQLLINKGVFSESLSRMYTAELTCAIEYVHELGFIHRDIKPDRSGHIKLTDFGLCTGLRWTHDKRHYVSYNDPNQNISHSGEDSLNLPANAKDNIKLLQYRQHKKRNLAHSIVGTGNYMAPEVIDRSGHTQACDWWSVGVILYEMIFGRPPFLSQTDDPLDTQRKILNWRQYLDVSKPPPMSNPSRACIDVILRLCCDEKNRLGRKGASEIKAHLWFKGIDFVNLRKLPAEYVPTVQHAEDTSNFDTFEVNTEELFRENCSGPNSVYNPAFFDFTFRHFFANDGAHKLNHVRVQQRPSLAPLLESSHASSSASQSPTEKRPAKLTESKKAIQAPKSFKSPAPLIDSSRPQPDVTHPIFNRKLQKLNTNDGLPVALHSTYANDAKIPPLSYTVRTYDKNGDSNV